MVFNSFLSLNMIFGAFGNREIKPNRKRQLALTNYLYGKIDGENVSKRN